MNDNCVFFIIFGIIIGCRTLIINQRIMKNFILVTFLSFLSLHSLIGQTKLDYDHDTKWFWGVNGGVTWHSTDIKTKTERGWGLTLGKSFNYGYGKALSFDLRSRFLYGEWIGQNTSKSDTIIINKALSSGTTNYKDSLGFYVLNFKNKLYSLDLELVVHANGLRERTNWDLYAFGGIGISAFKSYGDLKDGNGKLYQYDSLQNYSDATISGILDKKYESYLDGSSKTINYYIMPSIGIGLGYQLFRNISIGIEHRTTFARVDYFDGYTNPKASNIPFVRNGNDVFHYTNAYIRFQLHKGSDKPNPVDNNHTSDPVPVQRIPEINFTNPATSGNIVTTAPFNLRANIKYVNNRENINFKHNGVYTESFSYNNTTEKFESNVILVPGQNIFEIVATNQYGSDQKNTIIIFNEPQLALPVVTFIHPGTNPYNTASASMQVRASVLNVNNQSQVTVNVNGLNVTNFSFTPSNGQLNLPVSLTVGTNIITITGTNQAGSDSKTTTIVYNPVAQEPLPQVYFTDPNRSPYTTVNATFDLDAEVLNVQGKENITFKQNGNYNQNFTYNSYTHDFQSTVVLVPGQNVFEIVATNGSGSGQASTIIIYEKQAPRPPVVTITNPIVSPTQTPNEFYALAATVLNVEVANQIQVSVNNVSQNFNFNPNSHVVSATLNLVNGQNTVLVTATNNDGTDSKQTILVYRKVTEVVPPVVTFTYPTSNPSTVDNPNQTITALVLNVENNAGINVNVNGTSINNFNFNVATKQLSFQRNLVEGANLITITGSNTVGTDTKSMTIIYRKAAIVLPPTVSFLDPSANPTTVYSQNYNLIARVTGVQSNQNIQVRINGIPTNNFVYNSSTERVTFSSSLQVGANIFEISASNAAGSDSKSSTIIYKVSEPLLKPVVTITNPITSTYTTANSSTSIDATVLNITSAQNITLTVNGVNTTTFAYNTTTKQLNFLMPLNEGSNSISIQATNAAGTGADSRTIIYKKEVKVNPPLVTFIQPNQPNQTVSTINYTVKASIQNIENASQLTVSQNGQVLSPSSYVYSAAIKELKLITNLTVGNNVFTVSATNVSGNHSASTSIIYKKDETPCEKPVITFLNPKTANVEFDQKKFPLKAKVQNVDTKNQIELTVNGIATQGIFNLTTKLLDVGITLNEGQNIIEITAKNKCGEDKKNTIIIYKPANVPCTNVPSLESLQPTVNTTTVTSTTQDIRVSVVNISNAADIIFTVNRKKHVFSFDVSNKILTSTITLVDGMNQVEIQTSNECGSVNLILEITKKACDKPQLKINNTTVPDGGSTSIENFVLNGLVSGIESNANITVTQNNRPINFIYNNSTKTFTLTANLDLGVNTFVIKAVNSCGEDSKTITVTRNKPTPVTPPKVQITNPSTTPFNTEIAVFNVQATTQYITSSNQVSMTVNGQAVNPNFNAQNGSLTYNLTLVVGNNVIIVNASNEFGTASDTKTIIYKKPVTIEKPQITLTNPSVCPATLPAGLNQIKGFVKNITAVNQVVIRVNGSVVTNFNPVITNNKLNFQFDVNLSNPNVAVNIEIIATNEAGTDQKTCVLKAADVPDSNCLPTVSAIFSADDKSVTATSTKDLSNVVLKFEDGTVQKFDNLSGLSKTFSGTGLFTGKCIAGIWIKSGCNQSNDGPGYGEYVKNPKAKLSCSTSTDGGTGDCMPVVKATFTADSKSVTATSTKPLNNVVLKYFDGQEQKFANVNGKSVTLTGTGANAGKCIVGVWIKSGCNVSHDGPGYGEYVKNNAVSSSCAAVPTGDCKPTVSALFATDSKKVTVSSTKDLINVVLKYHDGQEQKFENLSGLSRVFQGTGVNAGKCIVGVWIKSGCNQSNDGPNYGEWVANPQSTTNCATGNGNNGHGNNDDGMDSSNPGNGSGGPNGGSDGSTDDESGKGKPAPTKPTTPTKPGIKPPTNTTPTNIGGRRGG